MPRSAVALLLSLKLMIVAAASDSHSGCRHHWLNHHDTFEQIDTQLEEPLLKSQTRL